MFTRKSRLLAAVAVCLGSLFTTGYNGGCYNLATQSAIGSIKPCGIFDCSNGLLGGAINPCGQPNNPLDDVFVGCP